MAWQTACNRPPPMRVTRTQVLPLLVLLVPLFGCKAGQVLRVASAVAITTVRVAAVAAAVSGHKHHRVQALNAQETAQTVEGQRRAEVAGNAPGQCTELQFETDPPAAPGSAPPPRASDCGNVLIQNEEGRWQRYGAAPAPVVTEP
jgi:hypothetical protein